MTKVLIQSLLGGVFLFAILLIVVLATGSTFGQRCAEDHVVDSPEWCECVEQLSKGEQDD